MRTRVERRKKDYSKALRKKKLSDYIDFNSVWDKQDEHLYDNLHQYSKNKIHCSCHRCSCKSKNKGKRRTLPGNYAPSYNPKISDIRKIERMDYEDE